MVQVGQPENDRTALTVGARAITIYFCAAIGGFLAALADIAQKEEASAVTKLTSLTARHLAVTMQPYWILTSLVILATALCFVFQPRDRKQSFIVGMGIIAAIMTVTPYRQPPTGNVVAPSAMPSTEGPALQPELRLASTSDYLPLSPAITQSSDASPVPTFELRAVNRSTVPADVAVSLFGRESSREFFQKARLYPGLTTSFVFDLSAFDGGLVQYAVTIDSRRMPPQLVADGADPDDVVATLDIGQDIIASQNNTGTSFSAPAEVFLPEIRSGGGIFGGSNSVLRKLNNTLDW